MWILFKSVARFFKKSKILLIGLIILILGAALINTVLNNLTKGLDSSYNKLVTSGNLHDFVINEKFTLGFADYNVVYKEAKVDNAKPAESSLIITLKPSESQSSTNPPTTSKNNWTDSYKTFYNENPSDPLNQSKDITFLWDSVTYPCSDFADSQKWDQTFKTWFAKDIQPKIDLEINTMKTELEQKTNNFVSNKFNTELQNLPITFREFNSVDLNNTKQNIFYKMIESNPNVNIDKLVIYEGSSLIESNNFYKNFFANIDSKQPDSIENKKYSREIVSLLARTSWQPTTNEFIEANNYVKNNLNFNPYNYENDKTLSTNLKSTFKKVKDVIDKRQYNNKDFRINFSIPGTLVPTVGYIEDFSSYLSVVPLSFVNKSNKVVFPISQFMTHINDTQDDFDKWFKTIDDKYKYFIDELPYLIIGAGISPDFMYPIVSFSNPIPNYDKELITYSNDNGYARVYDSFRGNNQENFLVGKFDNNVDKENILLKINEICTKYMSWPQETKAAYLADDINNILSPTALRLQFIPQILSTINLVAVFLIIFILLLSIIVSIIVIKRFIENNKNSLGIMLANGFKKKEIISSIVLFFLIPIIVSTLIGCFIGFLLQGPVLGIFSNLWTIPTATVFLTFTNFLLIILIPCLILIAITAIFSSYALRADASELMKDETKYKLSKSAVFLKKPFVKTGIMNTFRASVAFSSIWRLFLLTIMSSLAMTSLSFMVGTYNKFQTAANETFATRNYTYSFKLTTPSEEGGQYYAVPYQYSGVTLEEGKYFNTFNNTIPTVPTSAKLVSQDYLTTSQYKGKLDTTQEELVKLYGNYHLISSTDDKNGQEKDLFYLKNKSQSRVFLDHFLGLFGFGANPWELSAKLMPANQLNYSNTSYRQILEKAIIDEKSKIVFSPSKTQTYREALISFTKTSNFTPEQNTKVFFDSMSKLNKEFDNNKITQSSGLFNIILKPDFIQFFLDILSNSEYNKYQYNIIYNKIAIDSKDRPFSYVDFNFFEKDNKSFNTSNKESIIGIFQSDIESDNFIKLINENNEIVNEKIFKKIKFDSGEHIPIVINAFAQKKYNLNIGSTFKIDVLNNVKRYNQGNITQSQKVFEVVDIIKSYQNAEFYISQENANKLIGLVTAYDNVGQPTEKFNYSKSGFNGIFSNQKNLPEVNNAISLYSPSGLYIASDSFSSSNEDLIKLFNNKPNTSSTKTNLEIAKETTKINDKNNAKDLIDEIAKKYGSSSVYSLLNNIVDKNSSIAVFNTLSESISMLQNSTMAIIILATLVIVALVSSMIVFDSIKLASFLKCLGLNDRENAFSFLVIYIPVFIFGLLLAIPLIYLMNYLYIEIIFKYASILLIVNMNFVNIFIPMISILLLFLISYVIAWYKIKNTNLPQIIK